MKEPANFPHEHQASGMVFRIYSAPVAKTNKDGTATTHPSFLVKHYEGAKHIQKRQKSWEDVEAYVEEVVAAHRANDPERLELTGRDRRIYLAATEALEKEKVIWDFRSASSIAASRRNRFLTRNMEQAELRRFDFNELNWSGSKKAEMSPLARAAPSLNLYDHHRPIELRPVRKKVGGNIPGPA